MLQVWLIGNNIAKRVEDNVQICSKGVLTSDLDNWNVFAQLEEAGGM